MRTTLSMLCLVLFLSVAAPAQAQLREDAVRSQQTTTRLYGEDGFSFEVLFDRIFSPEHFRMSHSYEMSFSSFGGQSASLGMYTNTMQWQFSDKLAARVDVALMQPFSGFGEQQPRLLLRNAEVAYRPTENMIFHFQVQQSPYGRYMRPYGYGYRPYGYRPYGGHPGVFNMRVGSTPGDLFWKN